MADKKHTRFLFASPDTSQDSSPDDSFPSHTNDDVATPQTAASIDAGEGTSRLSQPNSPASQSPQLIPDRGRNRFHKPVTAAIENYELLEEEQQEHEEKPAEEKDVDPRDLDDTATTGRHFGDVQAGCDAFKALHVPGEPVLVINVHDILTACIAAEHPKCQALCVDLWTLAGLVGTRRSQKPDFFWNECLPLIKEVSQVCQRTGKLLAVDMGSCSDEKLHELFPSLLMHGVVGVDLRDSA